MPRAIIIDRYTNSMDSLILDQVEFGNHSFIEFQEWPDSLYFFTTCEFEDGNPINYTMNLMDINIRCNDRLGGS